MTDGSTRQDALVRRVYGRCQVPLTVLGFGAASIGNLYRRSSDDEASAAVAQSWQSGVRYFDTAPHYGLGMSERRLGAALAGLPRADYVVSTKVGRLLVPNPHPSGSDLASGGFDVPDDLTRQHDYSGDGVRRSIEESLVRLGLDRVDIVYVHDAENDLDAAINGAFPALSRLRDEGVIAAFGAGMNYVQPLQRIVRETDADILMVAGRWTLLDRSAAPLLDDCREYGVAVVAAAPFNSGLLATARPTGGKFDYADASEALVARAQELAVLAEAAATTLPAAALQFPLRAEPVVSVVSGMRTSQQVRQAVDWLAQPIADGFWRNAG